MPHLTVARTPSLSTRNRARKVTAKSQAELEEMEVEEMKKYVNSIYILVSRASRTLRGATQVVTFLSVRDKKNCRRPN